jgi:K+-sensing histidine kinase KdpD
MLKPPAERMRWPDFPCSSTLLRAEIVKAYVVSVVGCGLALVLIWLTAVIDPYNDAAPLLFLTAVGVSGWYGGLGPALVATVVGALAIDYFFEVPRNVLQISSETTLFNLLSFLLVAVLPSSARSTLGYVSRTRDCARWTLAPMSTSRSRSASMSCWPAFARRCGGRKLSAMTRRCCGLAESRSTRSPGRCASMARRCT